MLFSSLLTASFIFSGAFALEHGKKYNSYDSSSSLSSSSSFSGSSKSRQSSSRSYFECSVPSSDFSSSSSSSVSSFSSSSCSGSISSDICKRALQDVLEQPRGAAYAYFKSLQHRIERQAYLWLNPETRESAADNFYRQFGAGVFMSNAFGQEILHPDGSLDNEQFPEIFRSWALNVGSMVQSDNGWTYYSFPLFSPNTAEMYTITFNKTTASLPKNQFCFRKPGLNRLN